LTDGDAFLGQGWRFPPGIDEGGGIALSRGQASIEEAIRIILGTAPGERVFRPEFGCALQDLVFSPNNPRTRALACHHVQEALNRWEPRIRGVQVEAEEGEDGEIAIRIQYETRSTNHPGNLVYPFYLASRRGP
jgi:phage baseplate assembly protein W